MKIALLIALGLILIVIGVATGKSGESAEVGSESLEDRLEELCSSLSGVGECRVMVTYSESTQRYGTSSEKRVESVAVVCKGADKTAVRANLTELLTSLFGIGTNRISISKMK